MLTKILLYHSDQSYIVVVVLSRFHLDPSGTFIEYDAKAIGKLYY